MLVKGAPIRQQAITYTIKNLFSKWAYRNKFRWNFDGRLSIFNRKSVIYTGLNVLKAYILPRYCMDVFADRSPRLYCTCIITGRLQLGSLCCSNIFTKTSFAAVLNRDILIIFLYYQLFQDKQRVAEKSIAQSINYSLYNSHVVWH